jgi:DNA helicase-2/ATP-dependent DNA helicase PcrA
MVESLYMDILKDLNSQQKQAVTAGLGQTLVLAGPGSGKTRVLTHRIAYLIQNMGVRPYNILSVTFTNKAAREMEARLGRSLGESAQGIWLGTFHSICARILRREEQYLPYKSNFVIFDSDDQENLVKRAIRDLKIDEKLYRPASIHAAISTAKNEMRTAKDYPVRTYRDEVVARVYARYQDLLLASNAVDFDDLLLMTVKLVQENPEVRDNYARRFEHVLVDEFQDTNLVQYELLKHLNSYHQNIFVVGDEDQSIYRWRGADYRNVLRFEDDYPKCQKILLEQNYRSTQNVLDAARAVIDHNSNRTPKHLFSERGSGEKILLYEAADDTGEAAYVVDRIQQMLVGGRSKGGDFAVMYRTNAQSRLLEEAFIRSGLPYRLVGAQRFYGRREVKDMIAYLRMVNNPADEVSLGRVINVPPRGIGDKTMVALQLAARQLKEATPGDVLLDLGRLGSDSAHWKTFGGRGAIMLSDFGALLVTWRDLLLQGASLPDLFDRIIEDISYKDYVDDHSEEGQDRWGNVEELRRLAFEYKDKGLTNFLETLALVSDQDTLPEQVDAPTLLTLHAAKGLEFSQVFIIGLDEGLLPHSRSRDDPEEMAEERRLFYVGLTRARDKLYLMRAERRSNYGSYEEALPSRFIEDIPEKLLQQQGLNHRSRLEKGSSDREPYRRDRSSRWESSGTSLAPSSKGRTTYGSAPIIQQKYSPNMRVRHPVWGEGLVVESRIQDDDETVDVFFETVGFKRLAASLAKLEIIGS